MNVGQRCSGKIKLVSCSRGMIDWYINWICTLYVGNGMYRLCIKALSKVKSGGYGGYGG